MQEAAAVKTEGVVTRFFGSPMAGMTIAIVAMLVGFAFAAPNFFLPANFLNILIASSVMGLVAVGESYLIIAGTSTSPRARCPPSPAWWWRC